MEAAEILAHLAEIGTPPGPGSAFGISVGLDKTVCRIETEVIPFLSAGGSELQFVYGPYGRGKSHFLRTIEEVASGQDLVTAYVDCRAGESPFRDMQETYALIAGAMTCTASDEELLVTGVARVIEERLLGLKQGEAKDLLESLRSDSHLAHDFRNVVCAYGSAVLRGDSNRSPATELAALLRADSTYGVTLGSLYRVYPDLPRPLGKLNRRNAGIWLRSLLSLPQALGYKGAMILFDETEKSHSFHKKGSRQQQQHLANLRNFVDYMAIGAFRGCSVYYAVVEDFIEYAREHLEALSQRIERIHLEGSENSSNPRAVWASLDELTDPNPKSAAFYEKLASRIVDLGKKAGLPDERAEGVVNGLKETAREYADKLYEGAVREFVKLAASEVAMEIKHA